MFVKMSFLKWDISQTKSASVAAVTPGMDQPPTVSCVHNPAPIIVVVLGPIPFIAFVSVSETTESNKSVSFKLPITFYLHTASTKFGFRSLRSSFFQDSS